MTHEDPTVSVKTLYSHTESYISNSGWASIFFFSFKEVLGKAARFTMQYNTNFTLFIYPILSAEMLASAIRKSTNIKVISVNDVEIKFDITLLLDGSRESFLSSLAMLDDFSLWPQTQ